MTSSLKHDFVNTIVDWSGWRETPAGEQAKGDPAGVHFAEEAPGLPAESERLERKSTER